MTSVCLVGLGSVDAFNVFNCVPLSLTVPYPFLTENSLKHRLMIYAGAACLGYTAFWTINRIHGRIRRI
jgi:hypothetical protein